MIPAFMDEDGTIILINEPEPSDAGSYEFEICSQLDNSLNTRVCTNFDLVVEPLSDANITVSIMPDWMVNLEDQTVKVGDSLLYSPGI